MTKHLYIHIPFCQNICHYCDFVRYKVKREDSCIDQYIKKILLQLQNEAKLKQFQTIYIGGGTPNILRDELLKSFLETVSQYIDDSSTYEFTIELNPEFVTEEQVKILGSNKINRVSIGVQTTNESILKKLNRNHNMSDIKKAIEYLYLNNIYNISCDFIYALPDLTLSDIDDAINFIDEYQIHHVSFYALEVKDGSFLNTIDYVVDEDLEANHLEYVDKKLLEIGLNRYEVSNWSKDKDSESIHNKAYWLTNDWKAIGLSGSGLENQILYRYEGDINNFYKVEEKLSTADYYLQILMMGLRLIEGIDVVNNKRNSEAYAMYFNDIVQCRIRNNKLQCKNINLLHETLVNIVDETKIKQLDDSKKEL